MAQQDVVAYEQHREHKDDRQGFPYQRSHTHPKIFGHNCKAYMGWGYLHGRISHSHQQQEQGQTGLGLRRKGQRHAQYNNGLGAANNGP